MKRLIYFFFAVAMMLPAAGCNDDPDFIKNAPPSSGETDGTDDDSDAGGDGTVEGVDPNFQIYLCFGQSNMEGFASLDGTYNGIEDKDKTEDERFQVMAAVSGSWNGVQREVGHWYTAVPPLCRSNTGLCPADYFGRTMVEELSKTNPDIKVGVIVVAIGGAGIKAFHKTKYNEYYTGTDDWQRSLMDIYDGYPYGTLVDMARIAQKQGVIKGILMHQGETDGCGLEWRQDVAEIYKDLISDLSLKSENTPLLVGELLNDDNQGLGKDRNSELPKIKELVPNTYVVSSEGCTVVENDPGEDGKNRYLHFSSEGYRELGRHYAQTMLDILANQKPEDPNASVPASNNHFDLTKLDADLESDPNPSETSWNVETGELTTKTNGIGGWKFETPIDLTVSNYLIVEFSEKPAVSGTRLAIYSDSYNVFDYSYTNGTIEGNMIVIDIKNGTFETSKYGVTEKKTLDFLTLSLF
ncbi:sialate O-acetylesterase [uncultured Bacteroides sp.]|uniref:sialate O-acetylesterase n=2 Tax=uncultured Bacteroides sp. TaxID=162156 RepID=UPI0027D93196|nr:sialate O-acetylesterase [uncultured Bacteroides sp.]